MKILTVDAGVIGNNTYFICDDDNNAIVIDPSDGINEIESVIEAYNLKVTDILLTHGHFDHIAGVAALKKEGVKVYLHKNDIHKITETDRMALMCGIEVVPFDVDVVLDSDCELCINSIKIKVIQTPGHTEGGVSYEIGDNVFVGDTMFKDSFGRIDFYDSNPDKMISSLQKLYKLNEKDIVYPGHGETTTIGREKANNLAGVI